MSWSRFIDSASAAEHAVQVYDDTADLVGTVAPFLAVGSPTLVLATAEHWQALADVLPAEASRAATVIDAHEMLDAICGDGSVSTEAFEHHVGGAVDELAARCPGSTIRAFGELVDLLWQRGDRRGAVELEELWNDLQRTRPVALLCAYCADVFDVDAQADGLAEVFRLHTHARPVADTARLSAALDQALSEVLGAAGTARVYLDVARHVPRGSVPRAQAVIGWLCETDRSRAADVLERARRNYAAV